MKIAVLVAALAAFSGAAYACPFSASQEKTAETVKPVPTT
jgi:hypothetical protein